VRKKGKNAVVTRVYYFDVGHGTSNLIQLAGNRFIVIDTGPRHGWQVLLARISGSMRPPPVIERSSFHTHMKITLADCRPP